MTNPRKIDDERIEVTVVKHKDEILRQLQNALRQEAAAKRTLQDAQNKITVLKEEAAELKLTYFDDTGEEVVEEPDTNADTT